MFAGLGRRDLEHLAGHRLLEAVDAGDAVLHLEDGADFLDVELVEVGGFDLAEEDVLDLAGAERGFGMPYEWSERSDGAVAVLACENYHKAGPEATLRPSARTSGTACRECGVAPATRWA